MELQKKAKKENENFCKHNTRATFHRLNRTESHNGKGIAFFRQIHVFKFNSCASFHCTYKTFPALVFHQYVKAITKRRLIDNPTKMH